MCAFWTNITKLSILAKQPVEVDIHDPEIHIFFGRAAKHAIVEN